MAEGAAARALRASLAALAEVERDKAAVQLARRYAALLDTAAVPSTFRAAFDRLARVAVTDADAAALAKVRDALSAHTVASDLGPKYLAVLVQLGLTPAARGVKTGLNSMDPPVEPVVAEPKPEGKRDELKQRRDRRAGRGTEGTG